jgi:hypothetical protein
MLALLDISLPLNVAISSHELMGLTFDSYGN